MRLALVVTCLNDADTVFEALESVLSQHRLPDQFGAVVGPSHDGTGELLTFYEEEFDFLVRTASPQARSMGRENLRAAALPRITADWVMFLPACVYLYPHGLRAAREGIGGEHAFACGGLRLFGPGDEEVDWGPPASCTRRDLLTFGPLSPAAVLWRVDVLRDLLGARRVHRWGPFGTLGRLLQARLAGHAGRTLKVCLGERKDSLEASFCWTESAREGLGYLAEWWRGRTEDEASVFNRWRRRTEDAVPDGFDVDEEREARREGRIEGWLPGGVGRTE